MDIAQLTSLFTFNASASLEEVFIQAVILLALSSILSLLYRQFGSSLSNRTRLAAIFPFMALTTMLIIMVIKSSLALSLGLVGALSIVRFRAAIKDPEELVFIFLAIALGLGFGADQVTITVVFFTLLSVVIIGMSLVRRGFGKKFSQRDSVHISLHFAEHTPLKNITDILERFTNQISLTRLDNAKGTTAMFLAQPKSVQAIDQLDAAFRKQDKNVEINILHHQPLE